MAPDLCEVIKLSQNHAPFRQGCIEQPLREHRDAMTAQEASDVDAARACMQRQFANGLAAVPT